MSRRVRIVGGGLSGILAAFEAHRLGWRDITLHERFDVLGGTARPKSIHGREMRDAGVRFGGPDDPIVETLTAHGARFETVNDRVGSLSTGADGRRVFTWDFAGPAVDCPAGKVAKPADDSLAARIAAYPPLIAATLEAYVRWRLETDPAQVHADAAIPLAIDRVFPAAADLSALAQAKTADRWMNALYAIPPGLLGHATDRVVSLPADGFAKLFDGLHQTLIRLGVKVELNSLISPRQLTSKDDGDETVVWAADPTPLFAPMGLPTPSLMTKSAFTYVYEVAEFDGPCPVRVQNFTAQGATFRAGLYASNGAKLVVAECVREADLKTLPTELRVLLSGFGALKLGPLVHTDVQPREAYPSTAVVAGLAVLQGKLDKRFNGRFIARAWTPQVEINNALAASFTATPARFAKAG